MNVPGYLRTAPAVPGEHKLRILRIADVPNAQTAGMSGFILSTGREMEREGHDISYWFREELAPSVTSRIRRILIPLLIPLKVGRAIRTGARLDVVEIHEPLAAPYALAARLFRRRLPRCAVLSFGLEERSWRARKEQLRAHNRAVPVRSHLLVPLTLLGPARIALRNADSILVPSSADREYLISRLGVPPDRVSLCFTGVSEELFEVRRAEPGDGEEVRILFLGSWLERKGIHELTAAWRRIASERSDVKLTIAGVGDSKAVYADLADVNHVEVIESLRREDLPSLLATHDLFVLPSWFEGMPLSMLEAAAAGLPCVVSAVCGHLDFFRPDDPQRDGGILVPRGDPGALEAALTKLIKDRALRLKLGDLARMRARQFTWTHSGAQISNALDQAAR